MIANEYNYFTDTALSRSDLRSIHNNVEEWYAMKTGKIKPPEPTKEKVAAVLRNGLARQQGGSFSYTRSYSTRLTSGEYGAPGTTRDRREQTCRGIGNQIGRVQVSRLLRRQRPRTLDRERDRNHA